MAEDDDKKFDLTYVQELRTEAKDNRVKLQKALDVVEELKKAAETAASTAEADKRKAAETAAAEDGKYKDLYDALKIEFDKLTEEVKGAEKYKGAFGDYLKAEIEDIPEDKRVLIPESMGELDKLAWIKTAKTAGVFGEIKSKAPDAKDKKPGNGDDDTEVNPWKKETFNLTQQAAILGADRAKADRLKLAAKGK